MFAYLWNWYYELNQKSDIIKKFIKYCGCRMNYIKQRRATIKIQKWFQDHRDWFETEDSYNFKKRSYFKRMAHVYILKTKPDKREERMLELV